MLRNRTLAILTACLALAACESNEQKAERLRADAVKACSQILPGMAEAQDVSLADKQAKSDVAQREYNKFMAGR